MWKQGVLTKGESRNSPPGTWVKHSSSVRAGEFSYALTGTAAASEWRGRWQLHFVNSYLLHIAGCLRAGSITRPPVQIEGSEGVAWRHCVEPCHCESKTDANKIGEGRTFLDREFRGADTRYPGP